MVTGRALQRGVEGDHAAGVLEVALVGQHQAVAVDDPGGRRPERSGAGELGLERLGAGGVPELEIGDAVLGCFLLDAVELGQLVLAGGDDQLAAIAVRDATAAAVVVEPPLALDAEPRLQAAGRVVDAGMDDLAVARAGLAADQLVALQEDHLAPGLGQGAGDRKADHAGADHDGLDPLRHPA